jgi:hypothetical protein|tara:strand:+ start:1013 stop:1288 length:276 start_codon:yes stop_codon:yes gene_type:complete
VFDHSGGIAAAKIDQINGFKPLCYQDVTRGKWQMIKGRTAVFEMLVKPVYLCLIIAAGNPDKADPRVRDRVAETKRIKVWVTAVGKPATAN